MYKIHVDAWYEVEEDSPRGAESTLRRELEVAFESLVKELSVAVLEIVEVEEGE